MSGLEITPGARGIGISIPESHANDPVTNALYNNLMGNVPKKTKTPTFCNVCNQEFSSQIVLDMHLAGSKHQRKITSIQLMESLEQTESGFEKNLMTGVITCTICSVTVNSPQLLATHVAGNKHQTKKKGKRVNGNNQDGAPVKKRCTEDLSARNVTNCNVDLTVVKGGVVQNEATEPISEIDGKKIYPKKKERPLLDIVIPSCVTKLEENKTGGKFLCNPCGAHCNSDVQLQQHLESKKHFDKVSVKKSEIFSGGLGKGDKGWNRRGISRGKVDRGVRGNRRGGRLGGQKVELQSFKNFAENDTGAWDGITEITNNTGWTSDSSRGGRGNRGGRGDWGVRKATTTKWSSNLPSLNQNSNTTTSFSQKYNYDDSLLATSFSDGLGTSSLFSSPSDFGFSRTSSVNRPMRGTRGRVAQVTSYYIKPEEMSPYRRAENSFGNISTEYPSRIATDYNLQETEGYSNQASDFMSRKLEYHHTQSSSARAFDYDNNYVDPAHTATLEYDNNYGGNAYALGHNTRPPPHGAITYAYTQPLSQNFVAGGSIM